MLVVGRRLVAKILLEASYCWDHTTISYYQATTTTQTTFLLLVALSRVFSYVTLVVAVAVGVLLLSTVFRP